MFKDLFQHISDRIETVKDANNEAIIRFVDFDLGQLDDENPPVSFPCALLGFGDVGDFLTFADGSQQGALTVTVKMGFKLRERTHSKTPPQYRGEALEMLNTVEAVHNALQGSGGTDTLGKLNRTGFRNERKANFRVFELDYLIDVFTASPTWTANGGPYIPWKDLTGQPPLPEFCLHRDIQN